MCRSSEANEPDDIAALLLARVDRMEDVRPIVLQYVALALDIIAALKQRVDAEKLRNPRRALQIAEVARIVAHQSTTPLAHALAQWARGNAFYHLSRYQEALDCYQEAQAIYTAQREPLSVLRLQINQVAVLQDMSAFQAALDLAEQARTTCRMLGAAARRYLASLEMNVGAAYQQIGAQESALAAYERGRAIFTELHEPVETARIDINRANVLQEMGHFDAAEALFAAARTVLATTRQDQEVARADHNRGKLAYRRGHYLAALRFLEAAHRGFAAIPNPFEMATVNLYRSLIYRDLNLIQETITLAADAEQTFQQETAHWLRAVALTNQGIGYQRLGAYAQAGSLLQQARRMYQRQGAHMRVLLLDVERAALAWEEGATDRARRIARRLARLIDAHTWPALAVRVHILLARCALAQAHPDLAVAQREAAAARAIAEHYQLPDRVATHQLAGQVLEQTGDISGAWQQYQTALQTLEELRATLPLDEFQLGFLDDKQTVFVDVVRLGRQFANSAQIVAILNLAYTAPEAWPGSPAGDDFDDGISAKLQALREQWHWYQRMIETPADLHTDETSQIDPTADATLRQQVRDLETHMADLLHRRRVRTTAPDDPTGSAWSPAAAAELLTAIQQRLNADELLLIYYVMGDTFVAALVTPAGLHLADNLAPVPALQRVLRSWRFHIEHGYGQQTNAQTARAYMARLYSALVAPLEPYLADQKHIWLVVPPGWHDLPFAALYDGQHYLIERFRFTYLSAPDLLLRPSAPVPGDEIPHALVVGYSEQERLPHVIAEAHQVTVALTPSMQTTCLLEEAATRDAFRAALGRSHLLHLATHATFRPDNPMFSWIRLADARLTVADLYEITLPCRPLVVLSACETGRGQPRGGGLLGMGRGFLRAGAAGIVVSLWKIEDRAAAQVMTDLYTALQTATVSDPAAALCQAQRLACMRGEHPHGWASFIFIHG